MTRGPSAWAWTFVATIALGTAAGLVADGDFGEASLYREVQKELENLCSLDASASVIEESLNVTTHFVDAFTAGIARGPHLKAVVNAALEDVGESLNLFQELVLDLIESWIKADIVQDLINQLIQIEAEIWVAMNLGTAICQSLLDQAASLIAQLQENGVCCIEAEQWFWDQVVEFGCQMIGGLGHFVNVTSSELPLIAEEKLRARVTALVMSYEAIIIAAAANPARPGTIPKTFTNDRNYDISAVPEAISTWSESTLDAGFSDEAKELLEELIQYLSQRSEEIQQDISGSGSSLMSWFITSSCLTPSGDILVNVTGNYEIPAGHPSETFEQMQNARYERFLAAKPPPECGNLLAQLQLCHQDDGPAPEKVLGSDQPNKVMNTILEEIVGQQGPVESFEEDDVGQR